MAIFSAVFLFFRSLFFSRISLATEILVLRQQLLVLNRTVKRPNLRPRDRLFWVCLSRLWKDWRDALIIVKPDTVIKWHREGFRLFITTRGHISPWSETPRPLEKSNLLRRAKSSLSHKSAACIIGIVGPRNFGAATGPRNSSTQIDRRQIASKGLL
jgi:hypothetical protein